MNDFVAQAFFTYFQCFGLRPEYYFVRGGRSGWTWSGARCTCSGVELPEATGVEVEGMVEEPAGSTKFHGVNIDSSTGTMTAEFDCPADAWFFAGSSNDVSSWIPCETR